MKIFLQIFRAENTKKIRKTNNTSGADDLPSFILFRNIKYIKLKKYIKYIKLNIRLRMKNGYTHRKIRIDTEYFHSF